MPTMLDMCHRCDHGYGDHRAVNGACPIIEHGYIKGYRRPPFVFMPVPQDKYTLNVLIAGQVRHYQCMGTGDAKPLQQILESLGYTVTVV